MRVLLDENIPKRLFDSDVEVMTVVERGWSGKKNGVLLRLAEGDFDLATLILEGRSNDYEDLEPLMPEANDALRQTPPGTSRRIPEN